MRGVNGRANDAGKARIDQYLAVHDSENTLSFRIAGAWFPNEEELTPFHLVRNTLITQYVRCFLVQAIGNPIDDGRIVPPSSRHFIVPEEFSRRQFEESGTIRILAIDPLKQVLRKSDRRLDSHKIILPLPGVFA
jgi:hypothetical protein